MLFYSTVIFFTSQVFQKIDNFEGSEQNLPKPMRSLIAKQLINVMLKVNLNQKRSILLQSVFNREMSEEIIAKALEEAGNKHRYQKIVIAFFCFVWMEITFMLLGPAFTYMNPYFQCSFKEGNLNQEDACPMIKKCKLMNDFTITASAGLYCDGQIYRDIIQSFLYVGSVLGLIFMNLIADTFGRKLSIIVSLMSATLGSLLTIIGAYEKIVALQCLGQFANGFGGYSLMILSYIYISDLCQDKLKQRSILILCGVVWGLFEMSFFVFYYWFNQWYNFLIMFMFIPLLTLTIISFFVLVQTPSFLYFKKKDLKKCADSLLFIASVNNRQQNMKGIFNQLKQKQQQKAEKNSEKQQSVLKIVTTPALIKIILSIAVIQCSINMYYYGIQYSLEEVGFSFGTNILLTGLIETIANIISIFVIDKVPRRLGLACCNLVVCGMGLLFCLPFISQHVILSTVILGLCRFSSTFSQAIIPLLQLESFPKSVQSTGTGIVEALSQIGTFCTPYLVTIVSNLHLNPIIVVSVVVLLLGIAPLKFIRQTLSNKKILEEEPQKSLSDSLLTDDHSMPEPQNLVQK